MIFFHLFMAVGVAAAVAALDVLGAIADASDDDGGCEADGGNAALDVLVAVGHDGDGDLEVARSNQTLVARRVRSALRRRTVAAAAAEPADEDSRFTPDFSTYAIDRPLSLDETKSITFWSRLNKTQRALEAELGRDHRVIQHARNTTLWRYMHHRQRCLEAAGFGSGDGRPAGPVLAASIKLKWDETEQVAQTQPDVGEALQQEMSSLHLEELPKSSRKVKVMTTTHSIWCPTLSSAPLPWFAPPLQLQRSTAENMWSGLEQWAPCGPWSLGRARQRSKVDGSRGLPPSDRIEWLWFICVADEATGNLRLFAQMAQACRRLRKRVLTHFGPCFIHVLHRCILPVLHFGNVLTELFRAAHVCHVNTYWGVMVRRVYRWALLKIVPVHFDLIPNAHHRAVATDLINLAYCSGLPEDMISSRAKGLRDELLDTAIGDWTVTTSFRVACRHPNCAGGEECKVRCATRLTHLLLQTLFSRKIQIPSESRWYKLAPMARQTLFGVGFHGAFTHLAPANWKSPAAAGGAAAGGAAAGVAAGGDGAARDAAAALDREMDWHAIHAFRVRKAHEYFSRSDTASALILVLKAFCLYSLFLDLSRLITSLNKCSKARTRHAAIGEIPVSNPKQL